MRDLKIQADLARPPAPTLQQVNDNRPPPLSPPPHPFKSMLKALPVGPVSVIKLGKRVRDPFIAFMVTSVPFN